MRIAAALFGGLLGLGCAIAGLPRSEEWQILDATLRPSGPGATAKRWSSRVGFISAKTVSETQLDWVIAQIAVKKPAIASAAREAIDDLRARSAESVGGITWKDRNHTFEVSRVGMSRDGNVAAYFFAYGPEGGGGYVFIQRIHGKWEEVITVSMWVA